jgi:tetrahydromethanopterin S-methyltransferase subunit B
MSLPDSLELYKNLVAEYGLSIFPDLQQIEQRIAKLETRNDALIKALSDIELSTFDSMTAALARVAIDRNCEE